MYYCMYSTVMTVLHYTIRPRNRSGTLCIKQRNSSTRKLSNGIRRWLTMRTNPVFLTYSKSTIKFGCLLKIHQSKMGIECVDNTQNFFNDLKSRKKINEVTFRLDQSEPMKIRGAHDMFQCSLLKPFMPDKYGRYDENYHL